MLNSDLYITLFIVLFGIIYGTYGTIISFKTGYGYSKYIHMIIIDNITKVEYGNTYIYIPKNVLYEILSDSNAVGEQHCLYK